MCVLCGVVVFAVIRKCVNSQNLLCYVYVEFTPKSQRNSITAIATEAYELYFGCKFGDQDEVGTTFMLQCVFAILTLLAHWHAPINVFRSPICVVRREGLSYRLLLFLNKNRQP
jgi:hypothetical protein